ncbi:MAG: hypothetical protein ACE5IH_01510 [Thermodesulfobacteriota bacterium]
MNSINYVINFIFDLFFYPYRSIDPIYGLLAVSLLTTVIVLPIFKRTSNQEGIKKIKALMMGHILELRLFKDDIRIVLSAQKNILKHNMTYLKYTLKPLVFMMLPVVIIIIQTEVRYENRPLHPGETAVVKVMLNTEKGGDVVLTVPDGLKVETLPLRIDGGKEIYWRVIAEKEGTYSLGLKGLDREVEKKVFVTDKVTRFSPVVLKGGLVGSFLNPGELPLPDDSIVELFEIRYPDGKVGIFGWNVHWLVLFFILTMVFGFVLLKPFRVTI